MVTKDTGSRWAKESAVTWNRSPLSQMKILNVRHGLKEPSQTVFGLYLDSGYDHSGAADSHPQVTNKRDINSIFPSEEQVSVWVWVRSCIHWHKYMCIKFHKDIKTLKLSTLKPQDAWTCCFRVKPPVPTPFTLWEVPSLLPLPGKANRQLS